MSILKFYVLIAISLLSTFVNGATVCSTNCSITEIITTIPGDNAGSIMPGNSNGIIGQYNMINNVHSDGDLYLDYSIFSDSQNLNIGSGQ